MLIARLLGKAKRLVSTKAWAEAYVGGGDFQAIGKEFFGHFVAAGLQPRHDVLDIGCGVGRMALPLTDYLTTGSYTGIDISKRAIRYCRRQIKRSNFRFIAADIYNQTYNRRGVRSSDYRFPFADRSFDFVFLTSVFTHLLKGEVENYVAEIGRVIRPGGICFATWFLLDDLGDMKIKMTRLDDVCAVHSLKEPTAAIGYDPHFVRELYTRSHLSIQSIDLGVWARAKGRSWQDIVVAINT